MIRTDFPILEETVYNRPLIYLDNAATSQKPMPVIEAITYAYTHFNANIHRGVHHLSQVATAHHEEARKKAASFLGAQSEREIIFTKGTTDGLNMLAFSLGEMLIHEGDEIIVSALEHHSNIVPWQMLCERKKAILKVIPLRDNLTLDMDAIPSLLSERTRIISVAHVSNVLGIVNPVEEITRLAHERGIVVVIDGAQSAPHMRVNMQSLDADFYVCSGHKMYGPTGIGLLYGKEKWLDQLPPAEGGGEMIDHVRWTGTTYNQLPYKFEAGTPNFIGSYAMGIALDYMEKSGRDTISQHEFDLCHYMEEQLLNHIPGIKIYAEGQPKAGAVSFNVFRDGQLIHPFDIGTLLDRQGVAVRTGHHCAEPLIDHLGVPGTVRASVAMYNTREEIDIFVQSLHKAVMMLS